MPPQIDPETGGIAGGVYGPPPAEPETEEEKEEKDGKDGKDGKNRPNRNRPGGPNRLPGAKGADYHLVRYGDRVYVVYTMDIDGKALQLAWRIDPGDYKAFGVDPGKVGHIGGGAFKALNVFGNVRELDLAGIEGKHPFQQFIDGLVKDYGDVSFLRNEQFMKTWLSLWAEGMSTEEIAKRLEQTNWWQSRTQYQRHWELEMSEGDRRQQVRHWTATVTDALEEIYGPGLDIREFGFDTKAIQEIATKIASGKMGEPSEGFDYWLRNATTKAEGVEGSAAWITQQQDLEAQNAYANRPEDKLAKLKDDAFLWLGPAGMPSDEVLKRWADKLVVGTRSDADWESFLKDRARKLYPFLGANEPWQDFADPYKAMAERLWGMPVDWADPVLGALGVADETGKSTGAPLGFQDFERTLRADDRFYQSEVGHEEGMGLLTLLNEKFRGVV